MSHLVFVETTRPGIQALEAAKRLGHHVTLIVSPTFAWMLGDADREAVEQHVDAIVQSADTADAEAVGATLAACHRERPVDAALSTWHLSILPTALAADRLGLRSTSAQGMLNARDKSRCRELLDEHGIPTVRHRLVRTADEALEALAYVGYPAIIKPKIGSAKLLTRIVHDDAQARAHFEAARAQRDTLREPIRNELAHEFIVEELALGPLYSLELGSDAYGGWAPFAIVKRKTGKHNPVLEMGSTVPGDLTAEQYDEAAAYAIRVAEALGLRLGIFHVEFIVTRDGPRLVEVNPRIAGGAIPDLVRTATGISLFELLVRIFAGERIAPEKLPIVSAASHTFIAALEDSTVRADLPEDWFEPFRRRITSGYAEIRPGQALRRMDGNFDPYGVLRVAAQDYREAVRDTERLRRDVEAVLGVRLVETDD